MFAVKNLIVICIVVLLFLETHNFFCTYLSLTRYLMQLHVLTLPHLALKLLTPECKFYIISSAHFSAAVRLFISVAVSVWCQLLLRSSSLT